jgi:uncharacterized protein
MAIKINDIPPEGLVLELAQKLDLLDKGTDSTEFRSVLRINPAGKGVIHISGRIQATIVLECSRCLETFKHNIDTALDIDVAPMGSLGTAPEHELVPGELDVDFYQGDEIDPVEFVKQQLLISIPMVPLHDPDCRGLCSICGTDLNRTECGHQRKGPGEFGAFAALKDLLNK